jgi:endonuclease/exonuclease/phosphatase family metal-dependent hydrolase
MRLATFNINGRSPGENRVDLDRLANSIRTLAPDILALQEVDLYLPRSHDADLAAIVAEAMECVDHRFVAALAGTPGARWVEVGEGAPITGHRRRTQSGADRRHRDATWARAGGEHSPVVPSRP